METLLLIDEERALVAEALAGRRPAFDQLVDRYLERTFHVALRLVGNREDAEDLCQETFVRAHQKLDQYHGGATFGTWVTSICVRLCLDFERARKRRPALLSLQDPSVALDRAATDRRAPPERVQGEEVIQSLERAVDELPHRLRAALILRAVQGMDYDEVASALGTTVRSAHIYVSEARRRLADRWSRQP